MAQAPTPKHDEPASRRRSRRGSLVMPLAEAAPGQPLVGATGVKGEHIEDGERDPDTIAEEQRRRSAEYEAGASMEDVAAPDIPDACCIDPRRTSPARRAESRRRLRQSSPIEEVTWQSARLGIFRLTNQGRPHSETMLICLGGREEVRVSAQAAFKALHDSRPPLPARRRGCLFPRRRRRSGSSSGPPINRGASGPGFGFGSGWQNPFTAPHVDPTTGQPEMLTGPGGLVEKTRGGMNPFGFIGGGNPYWRGAIAGAGALAPTPAETGEFNPPMIAGRPEAPMSSVHGNPAAAPTTYPHMPWPDTGVAPAAAPAASPAAARQRPNLGTYGAPPAAVANSPFIVADRPNMSPQNSAQGRQGAPQMGMLDLSRLFGGGQPAPAAAAPYGLRRRATRPGATGSVGSDAVAAATTRDASLPPRRPKVKVSSTSEGGGYTHEHARDGPRWRGPDPQGDSFLESEFQRRDDDARLGARRRHDDAFGGD